MASRSSHSYDIQHHIVTVMSGIPSEHLDALVEQAWYLSDQQDAVRAAMQAPQ